MKHKIAIILLSTIVCFSIFISVSYAETAPSDDDYKGSLTFETSKDNQYVNISYNLDGTQFSYTVPNNPIYLSGGYAGMDDLGRTLPSPLNAGKHGKFNGGGYHYIGIFYFLWHGEHGDSGVFNLQNIKDTYGELAQNANAVDPVTQKRIYGNVGTMHWFAEPLYGYYYANDEWVIRKHMELLSNACVDFLYLDCTNGYIYKENALKVMKVCHELNQQGYVAPKIVFYTKTKSKERMQQLYDEIYSVGLYSDTWFYVDGKPCIVGVQEGNVNDFFTVKEIQWPNKEIKNNGWPWMDFEWPQRIYLDAEGNESAISVSIAQHNKSLFSNSSLYGYMLNRGRSFNGEHADKLSMQTYRESYDANPSMTDYGYNFQKQWDRAIDANVPYILVTGWNEWVAQRQNGEKLGKDKEYVGFVDAASMEFSRDAEMMRGGYFDNYYMQLVSNISRVKASVPVIIQDTRNKIDLTDSFEQWNSVEVAYIDPADDCADRNNLGFGKKTYKDNSGNNDIVKAKVTHDTENIYFYVETNGDISQYDESGSWMQLFVNTNKNGADGWYGYDYVINSYVIDENSLAVAACKSDNGQLTFREIGAASYTLSGNKVMICVPQDMLGIENYNEIYIEFKWADADENVKFTEMEDFYLYGDVAPLGRLNWIYQNYIPPRQDAKEDMGTDKEHTLVKIEAKAATCTVAGNVEYYTCKTCDVYFSDAGEKKELAKSDLEIPALGHSVEDKTVRSTVKRAGYINESCTICNMGLSRQLIAKIDKITIPYLKYIYNDKQRKPKVTVKDCNGRTLKKGADYTVTYRNAKGTKMVIPKTVGRYQVLVNFKGNYSGSVIKTFTIIPKAIKINKLTGGKKRFAVKWSKLQYKYRKQITGYEIRYSTSAKMTKAKKIVIKHVAATGRTVKKLKSKTKYYVQIRTYKTVNGTKYYSAWSAKKSLKTK